MLTCIELGNIILPILSFIKKGSNHYEGILRSDKLGENRLLQSGARERLFVLQEKQGADLVQFNPAPLPRLRLERIPLIPNRLSISGYAATLMFMVIWVRFLFTHK